MNVSLQFEYTRVSVATALELLLEPLGLGYEIRDGFVYVTTELEEEEEFLEVTTTWIRSSHRL